MSEVDELRREITAIWRAKYGAGEGDVTTTNRGWEAWVGQLDELSPDGAIGAAEYGDSEVEALQKLRDRLRGTW